MDEPAAVDEYYDGLTRRRCCAAPVLVWVTSESDIPRFATMVAALLGR